ncbi:MAG: M48 family metallopeptidase [Clostridiales bacterium]|nr:M48 family metallopeptidase [Clostridiales bacterium]
MRYTLIRSKRKTVALYVRGGALEVRAPLRMPQREIDKFVASKERWVEKHLGKSQEAAERKAALTPWYDGTLPLRGKEYPITVREGGKVGFDGAVFYLPSGLDAAQIKEVCAQIYRLLAKQYLPARTRDFAVRMGQTPSAVKISGARTRWGSCSGKGSLNLAWRLMMFPDDIIDYVIVHELTHIKEMNHSARFWAIVEGVLPDWRARRAKLKELAKELPL